MTKLVISTYDDNGSVRYGLFYGKASDVYKEDWKPVLFDTEEEAKQKRAAEKRAKEKESIFQALLTIYLMMKEVEDKGDDIYAARHFDDVSEYVREEDF